MKMPKTFYVGHREYRITRKAEKTPDRGNTDDLHASYNGMSYHHEGLVWIAPGIGEDIEREILLHEVMHSCIGAMGIQPALRKAARKSDDPEEGYVLAIAAGLTAVMQDPRNVALRTYLFGSVEDEPS